MKIKVEFNKYRKSGQNIFQRSFSPESLDLLLLMCDEIEISVTGPRKKRGEILFIFTGEFNRYAKAKNVALWILKKFLPETEWKNKLDKGKKR